MSRYVCTKELSKVARDFVKPSEALRGFIKPLVLCETLRTFYTHTYSFQMMGRLSHSAPSSIDFTNIICMKYADLQENLSLSPLLEWGGSVGKYV